MTPAMQSLDKIKGSAARPEAAQLAWRCEPLREEYLRAALPAIPRLLGAIDRNPYRPTYGCLDRQYWHYRTSDFPSAMYEEGLLPLALVYQHALPNNPFHGQQRVRELVLAGLRFAARASHADGSCDDYYPFERALGAAVFSLGAAAQCCEILNIEETAIQDFLLRRARWVARHDESGDLANHQALAALALARVARLTGEQTLHAAAERRLHRVLQWQSPEGWFREYGGADPGYQTVTLDALVQYRQLTGERGLDDAITAGVRFARLFLHPDQSYAGPYGSRGTYHFYPLGMELLANELPEAAELAEGFLQALANGRHGHFDDDRMFAHRPGNLIEAYLAWSPQAATRQTPAPEKQYLTECRLLVADSPREKTKTVISAARGGTFSHFSAGTHQITDAGFILETGDGRLAVANFHTMAHDLSGAALIGAEPEDNDQAALSITGNLQWWKPETVTPLKSIILRAGMFTVGRWCRDFVRRALQRRLITGRRSAPIQFTRSFRWLPTTAASEVARLEVVDELQLLDPRLEIRRLSIGGEFEPAYIAASGVYQPSVLRRWEDLSEQLSELNTQRHLRIVRTF